MGFFDTNWIVEFEYSQGIISSNKKGTIVVEASSEYDAKNKAQSVLKGSYRFVKILSAHRSSGRSEENKASYKPKINVVEKSQDSTYQREAPPRRELSPEERALLLEQLRQKEEVRKQKEKLGEIENKAKAVKRAAIYHIRMTILAGILSAVAFLFSWIPHWIDLLFVASNKTMLREWLDLGHSESDDFAQECLANIDKYTKQANSVLWIPFVILAIGIIITIAVFLLSRNKAQAKVDKASDELKTAVKEYEDKYGEIGKQAQRNLYDE